MIYRMTGSNNVDIYKFNTKDSMRNSTPQIFWKIKKNIYTAAQSDFKN